MNTSTTLNAAAATGNLALIENTAIDALRGRLRLDQLDATHPSLGGRYA